MTPDRFIIFLLGVTLGVSYVEIRDLRSRTCEVAAQEPSPPQFHVDTENNCVWIHTSGNSTMCWPLGPKEQP